MSYSREREALDTLIGFMEGTAIGLRMVGNEVDVERTATGLEERAKWAREYVAIVAGVPCPRCGEGEVPHGWRNCFNCYAETGAVGTGQITS